MLSLLAVLALSLGPARAVSPAVPGPYAITGLMDMASNGEMMLAVWADGRSRDTYALTAARIARDGVVLDPGGIAVSHFPEQRFANDPHVVWDGERFVIVWHDELNLPWAAAVSPDGTVTEPVAIGERNSVINALTANRDRVLAVKNTPLPAQTFIGSIRDDLQFDAVTTIDTYLADPTLAAFGDGYLLLWLDAGETWSIRAQKLDAEGKLVGQSFAVPSLGTFTNNPNIVAATDDDGSVIVAAGSQARFAVTRMHLDGTVTAGAELTGEDAQFYLDKLVPHAGGFDLVAHEFDGPLVLQFNREGAAGGRWQPLESPSIFIGSGAAVDGLPYAIWSIDHQVMGGFTFLSDRTLDLISAAPRAELMPAVATNGSSTLVAWHEGRDGTLTNFDVMARIDGGDAIKIGESADDRLSPPAVTFDGRDWVIAWKNDLVTSIDLYQRLLVRRLSPDGTLSETQTISTIAHDTFAPALASDGTDVLIAWTEGAWFSLPTVRVQLLGHEPFTMPHGYSTPSIAFDGTRYLVVATNESGDIIGMFVERTGAAGEPFVIAHDADPYFAWPSVAWNGERFLVVYRQPLSWTGAQYVSSEGTPLSYTFFLGYTSVAPHVTAYGGSFAVYRNGTLEHIGEDPVEIGEGSMEAALAPGVIVYSHHAEELQRVPRVFTRAFGERRGRAVRH